MLWKLTLDFLKEMGHEFINWVSPFNAGAFQYEWLESLFKHMGSTNDNKSKGVIWVEKLECFVDKLIIVPTNLKR